MERKYLYGIINTQASLCFAVNSKGVEVAVYTIHYQDLACLVSDTSSPVCDPLPENLLTHEKVLQAALQDYTVLPVRFGTILKDRPAVEAFLAQNYFEIKQVLADLTGKIELGLKVIWKKDAFIREIEAAEPRIPELKKRIAERLPEECTGLRLQLGQLVAGVVEDRRRFYVRVIYEPLAECAFLASLNPLAGERMVLNAAFLVEKEREAEFDRLVNRVCEKFEDRFDFKYTGPWAPSSFITTLFTREGV
ncbi:MAG: GvpL/GvpF family gas vesicle protein [Bacillota bacterium]|nr:GvpL/GvpF family gas vesicle protein [Bacillota bacterium]